LLTIYLKQNSNLSSENVETMGGEDTRKVERQWIKTSKFKEITFLTYNQRQSDYRIRSRGNTYL